MVDMKTLTIGGTKFEIVDAEARADIASLQAAVGSPLVASTVSAMTDHNKVYVYTGSESGYTSGNWYYHNGSAWVSGGVYNSVALDTDDTLSVEGMAADAKKTGDEIADLQKVEEVFDIKNAYIPADEIVPFKGNGSYYMNPFMPDTRVVNVYVSFYDANGNFINGTATDITYRSDLGKAFFTSDSVIVIENTTVTFRGFINRESFEADVDRGAGYLVLDSVPVFLKFGRAMTYKKWSYDSVPNPLYLVEYNEASSVGLLEQISNYTESDAIQGITTGNTESGRHFKSLMIYSQNEMRHAIRLGTFNIATTIRSHWYKLKECLENYGIDICGLQEVRFPLQTQGLATLADYFTGWAFPYVSDNGDAYRHGDPDNEGRNERNLLSRIPIDSTVEYELTMGTDYRYVAKSILSLPRYMDKVGSENLKLSVYNFQLEVSGAQTNADEVLAIVATDDNPFIILMGDTNDGTIDKVVWQKFQTAGFTPVVSTNTSTVSGTYGMGCLDNFFLSSRISAINYDVIMAELYPYIDGTGYHPALSDHDLVIADVVLDYSDIRFVNYRLTNVTASAINGRTWLSDTETLTITLTPASGYTLGTITAKDCDTNNPQAITVSGNTITLDGSKLIGDVLITCSGVSS